jgi:Putative auto-transporter adhesin, head GIN domain
MTRKYINTCLIAITVLATQNVFAELPINIGITKLKKQDIEVKNFNAIAAGGPIQVIVTLGNKEDLRFEGDEEAISSLVAEVKGNTLMIRPQTSWTSWAHKYKNKKIIAHVSAKTLKSLTMSGDGSLTIKGTINNSSLAATLSGSGSITANINVDRFTAVLSGSGKLNISGEADEASITLSGSASLPEKGGFKVGNLSSHISGSGSIFIHSDGNIDAFISGSGSINYKGNAQVSQKVIGSGKVRKV